MTFNLFRKTIKMNWQIKHFNELELSELYEIIRLRNEVFVIEQKCFYQDADGNSRIALFYLIMTFLK